MEFFTKYSKEILSYGSVKVLSCSGANNSTAYKGNDNGSNVGMMVVSILPHDSTNTGMMGGNNRGIGDVALDNGSSFIHNNPANSILMEVRMIYAGEPLPYRTSANDREFMVYFRPLG